MAKRRRKRNDNQFVRFILVVITLLGGLYLSEIDGTFGSNNTIDIFKEVDSNLVVTYLDVGQADSILIENNGDYMLIDSGNNEDGELLVQYFNQKGIQEFKYVVGTHPHEDHIGGLDDIINNFNIGNIYLPDAITTTKTFVDVLDAIESKNMTYTVPKIGEEFLLGDATIKVLYTGTDTSDLNNTSIVLRLVFGNTSFLFTGDATSKTEKILLNSNFDVWADVLKVGHHGSRYSTTEEFLSKVNPKYAIISVGDNNIYHHPEEDTLDKLKKYDVEVHRTDLEGTIVVTSDGEKIDITHENTNVNGG